jgi:glucokinase
VVGAGIVINGKLYRGDQGFAGQFGHMLIDPNRPEQCDLCGRNGCLSSLAGGKAISRNLYARLEKKEPGIEKFVQELGRNRTHPDEDAGQVVKVGSVSIDTRSVMRSATHDDNEIAKQVIGEEAAPLGQAIGQIVGLLDPPLVVLGGIWHDASFLSRKIGEVAQRYLPPFREKNGYAWLVQSILQDKAALLGAAHWVWNGDA